MEIFIEEDVKPIYRAILCSCHASLCIFIVKQLKEYIQTIVNLGFIDTNNSIFKEIFFGFSAKLQTMEEICLEEKRELQIYGVGSTDAILSRYLEDKTTPILELSKYLREVITEMDFSDMEKILEDIKSLSEKAFNFRVALERVKYERQRQSIQSHSSTLAEKPIVDSWLDEFIPISPKIVKIRQVIQEEDQVLARTAEQVHVEKRKSTTQPEPGTQREALLPNLSKRKKTSSLGQVLQPAIVCLERSS